ncbi:MAG: AAA family ATPase [Rhodospirillaceae bacterium]|nr:AAA family ATPase [Rhodospirillaceae bacterium]MBT5562393.1 AAA family ATPase [Rhodospirillaceae bacterium]MBT6242722.1 AAA family ATPase [Rhodospirillaceae bacterium]MBT7137560.1 AAA family ATPase [Rhodospirillaceae bacterium]
MLRFSKLRLAGFKSFVDPTELLIEPGLTGVVGPNGCGKSNLVEALRWVMGETSAKQMRGSGMEDVIFGGTAERPARNIAEVVLNLGNAERTAPAQFNEFDELDISRRIEREKGSTYRVNGKETRAKDVQLLFADSATGARSTAMVSQGRIGAVIAAKPEQRRSLLEEAAGITGLHSRRHEAELRLRGAETNLERLEDILGTLEVQMQGLKKQARQANRYRNLSDHIRKAEATLYHLRWVQASGELDAHRQELLAASGMVEELTRLAATNSTAQAEAATDLPDLRAREAETAAELHRQTVARDGLEAEEQRIAEASAEGARRLEQIAADIEREKALAGDATQAMSTLEAERKTIDSARQGEEEDGQQAQEKLTEANTRVDELDAVLTALTDQLADNEARRASLHRTMDDLTHRSERLKARAADTEEQRARLEAKAIDATVLADAEATLENHQTALQNARNRTENAEQARSEATENISRSVSHQHTTQSTLTRLLAEEQALADVLKAGDSGDWPAMIDQVSVNPGFEAALGAALGEDLSASSDEPAPVRWRTLLPFSQPVNLPGGAEPLSRFVSGPPALTRCLSQIGIVDDEESGNRLADGLKQGQSLVSRDGAMWRWDGFTMSAGAETAAAARLQQRNRLNTIRDSLDDARADVADADATAGKAREIAEQTQAAEREARADANSADTAYGQARDVLTEIKEKAAHHSSRLSTMIEMATSIKTDQEETDARALETREALAALPNAEVARDKITGHRADLAERRTVQVECQSAFDTLVRAAEERRRRLADIERELTNWRQRIEGATHQIDQLSERQQAESAEIDRLSALPKEIEAKRAVLMESIEQSEATRKQSADKLAVAETRLTEADKALRSAEADLAQARENRVRYQGFVDQAEQAIEGILERVLDKLDATPDQLFEIAALNEDKELPDMEASERKVERLLRERDTMGPVNLRAEQEMQELTEQVETLLSERDDLTAAIAKLRKGIAELNREGRQRLLASFHEVDKHFQELFVRLFGGGRAHLTLTDSDDPLEAGLEIMASPPGKRLQVLSLLSGGEQALTALALLFGVFLTNPAPICVLDEVDAPLDDANVDRFCSMLTEMSHSGHTRFLVITHHRLTMARMDRLFGVTMSERGVSQLVSVDLKMADELRKTA